MIPTWSPRGDVPPHQEPSDGKWYFTINSEPLFEGGHGPYDTFEAAQKRWEDIQAWVIAMDTN